MDDGVIGDEIVFVDDGVGCFVFIGVDCGGDFG